MSRKIFLNLLLVCLLIGAYAQKQDTLRVLFVGNSYTYFWNLPQTVEAMAQSQQMRMSTRQSTAGGTNWKQHWEGDKNLTTRKQIENGNWDYVILQNHSKSTIEAIDQFMKYGKLLIDLIRANGAEPILYQTWARAYNPLMQKSITEGYDQLSRQEEVEVIRIGELWQKTLKLRPNLELYDPDQSHPSPEGTYLTAAAFYRFLTGKKASELDKRIFRNDWNGEKIYLSIMSNENADFMLQMTDQFIEPRKYTVDEK